MNGVGMAKMGVTVPMIVDFLRAEYPDEQKMSFLADLLGLNALGRDDQSARTVELQGLIRDCASGELTPEEASQRIIQGSAAGGGEPASGGKRNRRDEEEGGGKGAEHSGGNGGGAGDGGRGRGGAGGGDQGGDQGRVRKAAKWDLGSVQAGQSLSFITDTMMVAQVMREAPELGDNKAFLRHQPKPLERGDLGGSMSSMLSEMTDALQDEPDYRAYYKVSHETLRGKLRGGERLTEEMFSRVEELGRHGVASPLSASSSRVTQGGSGNVYKLRLLADPQVLCALKTVPLHLQEGELDKFQHDVRLAYGHQHPNIVPLYDVCVKRMDSASHLWQLCIFMHYADCGSLATVAELSAFQGLPVPMVAGVAVQMLEALAFLHATAHMCHRDLKPSNILIRSDGRVMMQDFGNSRQLDGTCRSMDTFVGCHFYMSPERLMATSYTNKCDVWALALILLECLVGCYPYDKDQSGQELNMMDLLSHIVEGEVPLHLLRAVGADGLLCDFLTRLLEKDQEERPSSQELLLGMSEARRANRGEFEVYRAADGIGVARADWGGGGEALCRMWALPGAAQRAVQASLAEKGLLPSAGVTVPSTPAS